MTTQLTRRASLTALGAAALLPLAACASPGSLLGGAGNAAAASGAARTNFERDRKAILAMQGDYKVRFDFRETVPFLDEYEPIEPKVSGGNECVRVAEDTGDVIRLQHLLVVDAGGQMMVIKHWRQDWIYEPKTLLVYAGGNSWALEEVDAATRAGAWSQTVYQTDDSPRYGGVGRWSYGGGDVRWTSNETMRPLARRDAVRHPVYDRMRGVNRHALTPAGWVHEQDNAKLGLRNGELTTFVHEIVLNTYDRSSAFEVAAADRYWTATHEYWAAVRVAWDETIAKGRGVKVAEEPETGAITAPPLMGLADKIAAGETTTAAAIPEAMSVIAANT
jgi:hypothetical protein